MRLAMHVLVFICVLVSSVLGCPLTGTSIAQCGGGYVYSPTYGKTAKKFVSGCEIYLFGKYLEPVEGPDGKMGYLIEKTDSAVTLNGRHFYGLYDPQRTPVRPPSEKIKRQSAVIMEAMAEIRRLAVAHPSVKGAYFIDSILYADKPQPYVTASGDTVMLHFTGDEAYIKYEDAPLIFPLKPEPVPPKEERDKRGLDNVYQTVASIRPGFIVLIGEGYQSWYALSVAPALKAALAKIPALAQRRYQDMYGEWIYDPLTIDGYHFDHRMVADFAGM